MASPSRSAIVFSRHTATAVAAQCPSRILLATPASSFSRPCLRIRQVSVRHASIVPHAIDDHSCFTPPPPPSLVSTLAHESPESHPQWHRQQLLLQEQIDLEQQQRMRQQLELQLELAQHRNAIVKQQQQQQQQQARADQEEKLVQQRQQQQLEYEHQQHLRQLEHLRTVKLQQDQQQQQQQQGQQGKQGDLKEGVDARRNVAEEYHVLLPLDSQGQGQEQEDQDRLQLNTKEEHVEQNDATLSRDASLSSSAVSRPKFISTRHRSMFGYSGPEHKAMDDDHVDVDLYSTTARPSKRTLFEIPAEKRVLLAMMDYTSQQIDAMTAAQAHVILMEQQNQDQQRSAVDSIDDIDCKENNRRDLAANSRKSCSSDKITHVDLIPPPRLSAVSPSTTTSTPLKLSSQSRANSTHEDHHVTVNPRRRSQGSSSSSSSSSSL